VLLAAEKGVNDDYNIGSEEEVKIIDLAKLIWNICGRKEPFAVKHLQPLKYGVQRRVPDISKIKDLGWRPKVKLEEGLKYYINWYREVYKKGIN
jgi:nucleoside-diphosphate-sugar epimerase